MLKYERFDRLSNRRRISTHTRNRGIFRNILLQFNSRRCIRSISHFCWNDRNAARTHKWYRTLILYKSLHWRILNRGNNGAFSMNEKRLNGMRWIWKTYADSDPFSSAYSELFESMNLSVLILMSEKIHNAWKPVVTCAIRKL